MNRLPRSLFRSRRRERGPILFVTPRPAAAPPYLPALLELGRGISPGTVGVVEVMHNPECRAPAGGSCSCTNPEVRMAERQEA